MVLIKNNILSVLRYLLSFDLVPLGFELIPLIPMLMIYGIVRAGTFLTGTFFLLMRILV